MLRRSMLALTLLFCAGAALAESAGGLASSSGFWTGRWVGSGFQNDGSNWSIEIIFESPTEARINYATIPCGGRLYLVGVDGDSAMFREKLTSNPQNCIDNGTVSLIPVSVNSVVFVWSLGADIAEGKLSRVQD